MDECSICFDSLETPTIDIATTSCQHRFHISCLIQWFEQSSNSFRCPLCNQTNIDIETIHSTSLPPIPTPIPTPIISDTIEIFPSTFIEVNKRVEINSLKYVQSIRNTQKLRESNYRHETVDNKDCCCIIL